MSCTVDVSVLTKFCVPSSFLPWYLKQRLWDYTFVVQYIGVACNGPGIRTYQPIRLCLDLFWPVYSGLFNWQQLSNYQATITCPILACKWIYGVIASSYSTQNELLMALEKKCKQRRTGTGWCFSCGHRMIPEALGL